MENENPFQVLYRKLNDIEDLVLELKHGTENNEVNVNKDFGRLTRQEACDKFKISLGTLHKIMRSGKLPFEKIGRKTILKSQDLEDYFSSNRV